MASRTVCTACQRALQRQIRRPSQSQPLHEHIALPASARAHTFSTLRSTSSGPAAAPLPYQSKTASRTGKNPLPSSTPPASFKTKANPSSSTSQNIAKSLRESLPTATETYVAYGVCEKLVKECARLAEYRIPQASEKGVETPKTKDGVDLGVGEGWWYESLGLTPTFETWAQVTFLHMYLLTVRFRSFPAAHAQPWHQHLIDHFSYLAEDKMAVDHKMVARAVRSKYLKDLFVQWRGLQAGYDEGLVKGDAVLATAVWRNIFKGDAEVDWRGVGEVVSYMRHVLGVLGEMSDAEVAGGELGFGGDPGSERDVVLLRSKGMDAKGDIATPAQGSAGSVSQSSESAPARGRMMPEAGK